MSYSVAKSSLLFHSHQGVQSNNALHPMPVVGLSWLMSAFAPAQVSYGVGPQNMVISCLFD